MSKLSILRQLAAQLSDALPSHTGTLKKDFKKNCHEILRQAFNKFDLISREEFDIQARVLIRTRKKLDELQKQIDELEKAMNSKRRK